MKILYDYQTFGNRFGGISRYHYELSKGLVKNNHDVRISTLFSENEYLLSDDAFSVISLIGHREFKGRHRVKKILNSINQQKSIRDIEKGDYDIFHPTYYDPYFLKKLHKPFVLTVHDFVHEKFYPDSDDIKNKKLLIEKANKIIAISENTKNDILNYYPVEVEKISVIYHGYNKPVTNDYLQNIYGNYILFVGKRYGYKNFERFLAAVCLILQEDISLKVICAGTPFNTEELKLIDYFKISNRVIQISANDQVLYTLYKNALVFVFPSLYEGFGMPILEAFANNCPICISDTSCFPEIAMNAALYFDPYRIESIYGAIKRVVYNAEVRDNLISEGNLRLLDFSWEKTINETLEIYKELI